MRKLHFALHFDGSTSMIIRHTKGSLASTFDHGKSSSKSKIFNMRVLLHWRAYAKGKVERKKLYHVARAVFARSLKAIVLNAWIGFFSGTSRENERRSSQVFLHETACDACMVTITLFIYLEQELLKKTVLMSM